MKPRSHCWPLVDGVCVIKLLQIDTSMLPMLFRVSACGGTMVTLMFGEVTLTCEDSAACIAATSLCIGVRYLKGIHCKDRSELREIAQGIRRITGGQIIFEGIY